VRSVVKREGERAAIISHATDEQEERCLLVGGASIVGRMLKRPRAIAADTCFRATTRTSAACASVSQRAVYLEAQRLAAMPGMPALESGAVEGLAMVARAQDDVPLAVAGQHNMLPHRPLPSGRLCRVWQFPAPGRARDLRQSGRVAGTRAG
jgi:hypothetical protein